MLLKEKNPRVMIKIGYVFFILFFAMDFLRHSSITLNEDLFDGARGALMGISGTLLLWGTYLNGKQRRSDSR